MTATAVDQFVPTGMTLEEYQEQSRTTAVYPGKGEFQGLAYCVLGMCGEAGECANDVKKMSRDDRTLRKPERIERIVDEVGDLMWYVAQTCSELGISLQTVIEMNREKLKSRQVRGTLHGDGSRR